MKIGIDARFVGPQGTGLGKYTEKLILNLEKIDSKNQYSIFLKENNWNSLSLKNQNFQKVLADISWYSLKEQLKMPEIFASLNLDLLHIPHFNVPLFYKGKFVVTIHDLIHHNFQESTATTKNPLIFKFKRFAYRKIISHAVYKSEKIITPSKFVKDQIVETFKIDPQKIVVTYEAAEEEYSRHKPSAMNHQPFILYVGNAYPHKNLSGLLDAMVILSKNLKLVVVSPRDVFTQRLNVEIKKRNLEDKVKLLGYLEPEKLSRLFAEAKAYVFPSLSEGFGIPGLNAMASALPVICSNIPTLKEVYGPAALYFDPNDPKDIAEKIKKVLSNPKIASDLVEKAQSQVQKYSWQKMAKETLAVYSQTAI